VSDSIQTKGEGVNIEAGAKERIDPAVNVDEVVLKRLRFGLWQRLTKELAESFAIDPDIAVEAFMDWAAGSIAVHVKQDILAQQLDKVTVHYPADWRQAVKERFAPEWFTQRWPVRYSETVVDVQALYPRIALPREQDVAVIVRVLKHGTAQIERL